MLIASQLSVQKAGRVLLDNITFTLNPGELVMVLGPNGAGKSTLLRALMGAIPLHTGQVNLDNQLLNTVDSLTRARRLICFSQSHQMSHAFSVREVVQLGRYPYQHLPKAENDQAVDQILHQLNLEKCAHQPYQQLSGGEQQRVHMARVLAQLQTSEIKPPRFLLLDEPLAHVDRIYQTQILAAILQCLTQNIGVLMVVHDVNLALAYAHRVILLNSGKKSADGLPRAVLTLNQVSELFGAELQQVTDSAGKTWFVPMI